MMILSNDLHNDDPVNIPFLFLFCQLVTCISWHYSWCNMHQNSCNMNNKQTTAKITITNQLYLHCRLLGKRKKLWMKCRQVHKWKTTQKSGVKVSWACRVTLYSKPRANTMAIQQGGWTHTNSYQLMEHDGSSISRYLCVFLLICNGLHLLTVHVKMAHFGENGSLGPKSNFLFVWCGVFFGGAAHSACLFFWHGSFVALYKFTSTSFCGRFLFIYLLKAYSPVNCTGSLQGLSQFKYDIGRIKKAFNTQLQTKTNKKNFFYI